jgi:Tol biopolymer transport system component
MTSTLAGVILAAFFAAPLTARAAAGAEPPAAAAPSVRPPLDAREVHLTDLLQLTRQGENAEAYWAPDGRELILQSTHPPYACDQIFRLAADGSGPMKLVSTGRGRTTCSYFTPDGSRILYSSTHLAAAECPPPPDRSHGYVWSIDGSYEIWSAKPDGTDLVRLTDNQAYDAETTVCPRDGTLIFTSTRDGDLDLYRMKPDGSEVKRLTNTPGYDGGAFFSRDCSQIVWRASRPKPGPELDEYKALLAKGLVRPTQLEIWVANADGTEARQVTYLGAASFAPYFYPDGKRIIFSSNYGDPKGREFDLWAINVDGSGLERITFTPGFDGFPMFSPDGTRLAFSSNRNPSAPGETDVFVASWVDRPAVKPDRPGAHAASGTNGISDAKSASGSGAASAASAAMAPADRFAADVRWLADDAREGRGIGTKGLDEARDYLARRFRELGLERGGSGGSYMAPFSVPVSVEALPETAVRVDGAPVPRDAYQPASFAASGEAAGEVVAAGYGISAPELEIDDYRGVEAKGKIVAVRRFTLGGERFAAADVEKKYSDLRYKTWNAREHGAVGLVVVDAPPSGEGDEAPLPSLALDMAEGAGQDAGLPVVLLKRQAGGALFAGAHRVELKLALARRDKPAANVVGVLRAPEEGKLPGAVLIGAHYDHLGLGGAGSLAPDAHEPHNGADDNASGTAALLEVARRLVAERGDLRRDVWFVAFSGEESGVLGSTDFTRHPPAGPAGLKIGDLEAMLNMDMVGRLRDNQVTILGGESAAEWMAMVPPLCDRVHVGCALSGDGYGPSDHSPFYAAGVPVLHFFTGAHADYHKPSDDADKINAGGGAKVAELVAEVAVAVAGHGERLAYKTLPAPAPRGDVRSFGASLGTVPDYAGDGRPGVLLAGVRAGGPAEKAGLRRGDLLVELGGKEIRDIHDLMFVLQRAKPGESTKAVVEREGGKVTLEVTYGTAARR